MTRTQAKRFREMITRAAAKLTNAEALTSISLFEPWSGEKDYSIGDRVRDGGKLYRCYNAISANPTWRPSVTPAHWERVTADEDGTSEDYNNDDTCHIPLYSMRTCLGLYCFSHSFS